MKKSIVLLAVAALSVAAPVAVFATEPVAEFDTELFADSDSSMTVEDKNGPGASDLAPGAGTYVENIESNEIVPRPDGKVAVVETRIVNGEAVDTVILATREEGTGKADAAKDPAAPAEEAPKAEDKKAEAKPAAKAVKPAATKTASKALPKTSAVK